MNLQKSFIYFFINFDPSLTHTQILTLKLNPNLTIALSNTRPNIEDLLKKDKQVHPLPIKLCV